MAIIRINKGNLWDAAGYVFRHILEESAENVISVNPEFGKKLQLASSNAHFSLENANGDELALLLKALLQLDEKYTRLGDSSFADPSFYPGFMARVKELIDRLRRDERLGS